MASGVDPVTTEIVKGALVYAAEEMGIALRNAAYSPNIKERMDHSCAIFDSKQRLAAQAEHIPVHLGSISYGVVKGLEQFRGKLNAGDAILLNDPYVAGTHLPDVTLINPVFFKEELLGYTANKAHHSDVGGKAPGSMAGDSTELYQEGIIIPPIKFMHDNTIIDDVARLLARNVRTPEVTMGDLRAQIAANLLGERRLIELADRYGVGKVQESIDAILDYSEEMMKAEIKKMPAGSYEAVDYIEDTGVEEDPVKIMVTITIREDQMKIDYTGTDRQVEGPMNAVWGVTLSGAYYALKCLTDSSIPTNDGCYRPISVYAPPGTLLNPIFPAAVAGGNVETSQRNADVLLRAFAQLFPMKVCAACQGTMNNTSVGGFNPNTGHPWSLYETIGGGFGGRPGLDGVDGIHSHMTNTMNTPIEALEQVHPMRFVTYELRNDTGGPGRWRGGAGIERSWMLTVPSATLSILAERNKIQPWGLKGGKPGALGGYFIVRSDGTKTKLKSKCTVRIHQGDIIIARTPGGGGYGDPLRRAPELVFRDFVDGLVSLKSARNDYGVLIDRKKRRLDLHGTRRLRKSMKLKPRRGSKRM